MGLHVPLVFLTRLFFTKSSSLTFYTFIPSLLQHFSQQLRIRRKHCALAIFVCSCTHVSWRSSMKSPDKNTRRSTTRRSPLYIKFMHAGDTWLREWNEKRVENWRYYFFFYIYSFLFSVLQLIRLLEVVEWRWRGEGKLFRPSER